MFWGVTLESGKRYTQVVDNSFHVSMAALEPLQKDQSGEHVKVMIEHRNADFLLCTLTYNQVQQIPLDLNFVEGEEICFYLDGVEGTVHLTGYLSEYDNLQGLDEEDDEENASDEEGSEDNEVFARNKKQMKNKVIAKPTKDKKLFVFDNDADSDEESSDDDFVADEWVDQSDEDNDDEEVDEEEESEEEEEEIPQLVGQKRKRSEMNLNQVQKMNIKQQQKKETLSSISTKEMSPEKKADSTSKKKRKQKNKKQKREENSIMEKSSPVQEPSSSKAHGGKVLAGGVRSQDLLVGSGPVAKSGKKVHVYYTGRLANNNKQFDACQSGKPFSFVLGRGTVIKGWETGIEGMKVGGKRRLVIPPSQGYANERVGTIPPNSTLTFDVELRAVS